MLSNILIGFISIISISALAETNTLRLSCLASAPGYAPFEFRVSQKDSDAVIEFRNDKKYSAINVIKTYGKNGEWSLALQLPANNKLWFLNTSSFMWNYPIFGTFTLNTVNYGVGCITPNTSGSE